MFEVRDGHDRAERRVPEREAHDVANTQFRSRFRQQRHAAAGRDQCDDRVNVGRFLSHVSGEPGFDARGENLIVDRCHDAARDDHERFP